MSWKWTHIIHALFGLLIGILFLINGQTLAAGLALLVIFGIWEYWNDIALGTRSGWFDFLICFIFTVAIYGALTIWQNRIYLINLLS